MQALGYLNSLTIKVTMTVRKTVWDGRWRS
jgi:hypothetical protein